MSEVLEIEKVSTTNAGIDTLEKFMLDNLELINEELRHIFTPGLYVREYSAKANTLVVSRTHKTDHPFIVSKGVVSVWIDGVETIIEAPYSGITKAGTRRVLFVHEDLIWTTIHANPDNLTEDEMVALVTEEHDNSLFSEEDTKLLNDFRSGIKTKYLTV